MSAPRFMLDEHVWAGLTKVGERIGADVVSVQMLIPQGSRDEDVLALASEAKRILLTSNARDFAPLAAEWFLAGREHWGIIIVPGQADRSLLSIALTNIHRKHSAEVFKNTFRFIQDFV